jgi:hypothetical protein
MRGRDNCSKVNRANTADKIRACIITKKIDATQLPQFGGGNLVVTQL